MFLFDVFTIYPISGFLFLFKALVFSSFFRVLIQGNNLVYKNIHTHTHTHIYIYIYIYKFLFFLHVGKGLTYWFLFLVGKDFFFCTNHTTGELLALLRMAVNSLEESYLLQLTYYVQKLFITVPLSYEWLTSTAKNHSKVVGSITKKVTNGDSSYCRKGWRWERGELL